MWNDILKYVPVSPANILELGPNIGFNLRALRLLLPQASLSGIEINAQAVDRLKEWGEAEVTHGSILDYTPGPRRWDLVFTSGVLIHINPEYLQTVYKLMHMASTRYICLAEYYNPTPVEVAYRGNAERLYKRDFAGDILDMFSDVRLLGYGCTYRRDTKTPHDDLMWFVLEKY